MGDLFHVSTDWAVNAEDIDAAASFTSGWRSANTLEGMNVCTKMTSAGAAALTVTIDISFADVTDTTKEPADYDQAFTLVSAETTKTFKIHDLSALATDIRYATDRPFCQYRIKAAIATADATAVYVGICRRVA